MAIQLTEEQKQLIEKTGGESIKTEKVLEVKDLAISFRTDNGKVQAVRGVSFDLHKGETLCIVGESGSGKSVTSKAIMGILSNNAIVEGGQIIYEGEDLLKVSEEEFHRIRGHKIGMIFQDPLSSLNPIVKIGKQIIETTMINANQLKSRYNELISKELTAYKNAKVIRNTVIDHENFLVSEKKAEIAKKERKQDEVIASLNSSYRKAKRINPKTKAMADEAKAKELEGQIAAEKDVLAKMKIEDTAALEKVMTAHDVNIDAAKQTYLKNIPALKAKLKAKQAEAKADNKTYKQKLIEDKNAKLKELDEKEKAIVFSPEDKTKLEELDKKILLVKAKYKALLFLTYFMNKTKQGIRAKRDKELKDLTDLRSAVAKPLDDVREEKRLAKEDYQSKVRITKTMAKERALKVMEEVGIPQPEKRFYQYPFQFSGGMRQRIVIAIALTANPDILICDEPTTALDVTIQAQILELINNLKAERNLSCIFITHDLGVVANMADRVAVMYAGKICEYGTDKEVFFDPRHPYTWALLSSIPDIDSKEKLEAIPGTPPDMIYPPVGDAFAARNKYAMAIDYKYQPPFFKITETHYVASWLEYKGAPTIEPPKIVTQRIYSALRVEEAKIKNENN